MKTKSLTISILIIAVVGYSLFFLISKKNDQILTSSTSVNSSGDDIQSGGKKENLRDILTTLSAEGYYNNGDSNQIGAGFLVESSTGIRLGVSPFYNQEKKSTRYYLNETGSYEIYDSMELNNSYHECAIKNAENYNPIIVSYVGEFPENFNNFKIEKAYGVNFELKKFTEIDSNSVICYPPNEG